MVDDPARGHFEREVNDVYQVYEIQVKAENELGEAHQPPFIYRGRSGEAGIYNFVHVPCRDGAGIAQWLERRTRD